jgi:superfamily II DNA or RNA helicase
MEKWQQGTEVRRIDNPAKVGVTTGAVRERVGLRYFSVRWQDGTSDYVAQDQLEQLAHVRSDDPYELLERGRYGRAADLRRSLTHVHLSGRLANLVYSMGVSNTDFWPHQYRPLLTLLESPATGLLIADEVGLGKTIEAGIIWTELRAREDMRRLLIVCPAMLREKWQDELALRFGLEARIVNAKELLDDLKQTSRSGPLRAWITSYQALRPPKSWRPTEEQGTRKISSRAQLAYLLDQSREDEALLDLVVFDEAHYMRNSESAANTLGELLRDVAHYRVLLSATPINLANEDLFQLLRLCDPEHFQYPSSFSAMLEANRPLVQARDAVLRIGSSCEDIMAHVRQAAERPMLQRSQQLRALLDSPPTSEQLQLPQFRVELASMLERANLLAHVITRTRKRDVQVKRPKRMVSAEKVPMTAAEQAFYAYVTEATREFAHRRGISDGFLLATPQRQVCSCPAAFADAWLSQDQDWLDDVANTVLEDSEEEDSDVEYEDISTTLKEFLLTHRPRDLDVRQLRQGDSKFARLQEVLREYFAQHPSEKVILFTSFRATAKYLATRLSAGGIPATLVWGNMAVSKQQVINGFKSDPEQRVLISTEVAAEGVDLQFSWLLVNYDLPWNPMRVEQRIGRIDRLGQKAEVIRIWNLFYKGTIDERIFTRLMMRLRIFEETLGEPEPIVGEVIQRLEAKLLTEKMSAEQEEAEIERAAMALQEVRRRQEELEKNAAQMMAHGGLILDRIAAANELSRRITEEDLVVYVRDFLAAHAPGHQFARLPEADLYSIQLPMPMAVELEAFCGRKALHGQTALGGGFPQKCRFINRLTAERSKQYESIHQFHPLIRFIAEKLAALDEAFYPLVALTIKPPHERLIAAGTYVFVIRRWTFQGVKDEEWLQMAACALGSGEVLSEEDSDYIVNAGRLRGGDWLEAGHTQDRQRIAECIDLLEVHLGEAYQRASVRKQSENADRLAFQLQALEDNLARKLATLRRVRENHELAGRRSLVRATQARIEKLEARMEHKRSSIQAREKVVPDQALVCVGIVQAEA